MTIYSLYGKVNIMERKIHDLYCYLKNNPGGGGTETDPIFSSSPAASITQTDIDNWNAGGSGGAYVPLAGMDIQAGERMLPDFLLANYNILTEQPPTESVAVAFGQTVGGLFYQGTSGGQYTGSFNASPSSIQTFTNMFNSNGNYNATLGLNPSSYSISVSGSTSAGNYSGTSGMYSGMDLINKSNYSRLSAQGYDSDNDISYNYEFSVSQNGYKLSDLPVAQGDINYTRQIVSKGDGTLGWIPLVVELPSTSSLAVNTTSYPEISTIYVNKVSKKNSVVQLNLNLVMQNYAGGNQFYLAILPYGYRPNDNILIQANIRYLNNGVNSVKIVNLLISAGTGELSIFENFPSSSYMEIYIGTQFTII